MAIAPADRQRKEPPTPPTPTKPRGLARGGRRRAAVKELAEGAAKDAAAQEAAAAEEAAQNSGNKAIDALADAAEVLQSEGYYVVVAQRWPGSRNTLVELLLIGSSGVFVLAANNWHAFTVANGVVDGPAPDIERAIRALSNTTAKVESELVDIGIAPGEIIPVAVTEVDSPADAPTGIRHGRIRVVGPNAVLPLIRTRGRRFPQRHVEMMARRLATVFPDQLGDVPELDLDAAVEPEQLDVAPWMTFLTPDQAKLAHKSWNGPARLRGAAGTGKTVVGMHRAAYLATAKPGRVLVASLVRTLPKVMESAYARLSPETADKVDFTSVHRFALDVLNTRGVRTSVDLGASALAFRAAWDRIGARSVLADQPVPATYWQEEIDHVIKGRGVSSLERYLTLDRVGRRYPAKAQLRTQLWSLLNVYQSELAIRGVHDLADMLLMADAELERQPWHVDYSAVIIDEAQDLSPVGVRMLHRLVGDRPDGLLLIADGQQGVTPGGFNLAESGVDVTGRDALLRYNLRSDELLGQAAHVVVSGSPFDDLDGFVWHPDRDLAWAREGGREPRVIRAANLKEHDTALLSWIGDVVARSGDTADIAVLAARHTQVGHYRELLVGRGYDVVDLDGYDGSQTAVKIGTMRRAKGLTFAHVALTQLHGTELANTTLTERPTRDTRAKGGQMGVAATLERAERERREVFSAISRVNLDLWMGYLAD